MRTAAALLLVASTAFGWATDLTIDIQASRDQQAVYTLTDGAARLFGRNAARLPLGQWR